MSLSLAGGNHIYSMFEAGFGSGTQPKPCGGTAGQAMSGTYGECDGGLSVEICEQHLAAECPGANRRSVLVSPVLRGLGPAVRRAAPVVYERRQR